MREQRYNTFFCLKKEDLIYLVAWYDIVAKQLGREPVG
jgi:hypothetical protein